MASKQGYSYTISKYHSIFKIDLSEFGYTDVQKLDFINDMLEGKIEKDLLLDHIERQNQGARSDEEVNHFDNQDIKCRLNGFFIGTLNHDTNSSSKQMKSNVYAVPIPSQGTSSLDDFQSNNQNGISNQSTKMSRKRFRRLTQSIEVGTVEKVRAMLNHQGINIYSETETRAKYENESFINVDSTERRTHTYKNENSTNNSSFGKAEETENNYAQRKDTQLSLVGGIVSLETEDTVPVVDIKSVSVQTDTLPSDHPLLTGARRQKSPAVLSNKPQQDVQCHVPWPSSGYTGYVNENQSTACQLSHINLQSPLQSSINLNEYRYASSVSLANQNTSLQHSRYNEVFRDSEKLALAGHEHDTAKRRNQPREDSRRLKKSAARGDKIDSKLLQSIVDEEIPYCSSSLSNSLAEIKDMKGKPSRLNPKDSSDDYRKRHESFIQAQTSSRQVISLDANKIPSNSLSRDIHLQQTVGANLSSSRSSHFVKERRLD